MQMIIEHFGLPSKNTRQLAEWYCDKLGFKMILEGDSDQSLTFIGLGSMVIEIVPPGPDGSVDNAHANHLALRVESNAFDMTIESLQQKGIVFEPERSNELFGGTRMRFFEDPEGHRIQILSRKEPSLIDVF